MFLPVDGESEFVLFSDFVAVELEFDAAFEEARVGDVDVGLL